jgi:AcrR family transcriptional regulator
MRGTEEAGSASAAAAPPVALKRDPERTRQHILGAAIAEFASKGLDGARVNEIADRAGANKRMLYHYFGNKEELYLAALESVYETIRARERQLRLGDLPPEEGVRELVRLTWRHFLEHPEFISMLNNENLHEARHLRRSKRIRELHSPLVDMLSQLLASGAAAGIFRAGVDPVQLYVTIASLGYFYLSNRFTLSTVFGRALESPQALDARLAHMTEVILSYLKA